MVALFIARALCGLTHVTVAALCPVAVCCVSRTVTEQQRMKLDDQWVLTVMKSAAGEICHQYSSVVTAIIPYLTHHKTLLGDDWECVRPARLPVLTWVPSSVLLGTTSKIRSPPGPPRIQQSLTLVTIFNTFARNLSKVSKESFSALKLAAAGSTKLPCTSDYTTSHPRGWYDVEPLRENLKWRRSVTDSVLIVHVSAQGVSVIVIPLCLLLVRNSFATLFVQFFQNRRLARRANYYTFCDVYDK